MQIMSGTKREVTLRQWEEQLEKCIKRANESMESFRRYHDESSVDFLIEDAQKIEDVARNVKEVIHRMDAMGLR